MAIKDRILEIYKVEAEKYNKTRDIQWKMNVAYWTVLVVAIYAKANGNLPIAEWDACYQVVAYTGFLLVHVVFVSIIHSSLDRSLNRMHNMAEHLTQKNVTPASWSDFEQVQPGNSGKGMISLQALEMLQIIITGTLLFIFYFIQAKG